MGNPRLRSEYNTSRRCWFFYDPQRSQWFRYDQQSDRLIYDKDSVSRPQDVPRSYYLDPRSEQSRMPQYDVTKAGSPSNDRSSTYALDSRIPTENASSLPAGASGPYARPDPQSSSGYRQTSGSSSTQPIRPTGPVDISPNALQRQYTGAYQGLGSPPTAFNRPQQVGSAPRSYGGPSSSAQYTGPRNDAQPSMAALTANMAGASLRETGTGPVTTSIQNVNGIRTVYASNSRTQVKTAFQTAPAESISDPVLWRHNIPSQRRYIATDGPDVEVLYPEYYVRRSPRQFFVVGRVFMMLWAEPAGEGTAVSTLESADPSIVTARFPNERVLSKVRRFVVIRAGGDDFCTAIPIVSYGSQGVGKRGVVKSEHCIIHSTKVPPEPLASERARPGERGLRRIPIRVVMDNQNEALNPFSRLHFSRVSTIQHNVKVKAVGMVHPESMRPLTSQFQNVWRNVDESSGGDDSSSGDSDADDDGSGDKRSGRGKPNNKGKGRMRDSRVVEGRVREKEHKQPHGKEKERVRGGKVSQGKQRERGSSSTNQRSESNNAPRNMPRQNQTSIDPAAAMWARGSVADRVKKGLRMDQAVSQLARTLQGRTPGKTMDTAIQEVHNLLAQSNTIIAQQQSSAAGPSGSSGPRRSREANDDESSEESE